ncbi:MAG TPA: hypothetical protein VG711_05720 [Phycisphaerales bacterium]|nr:hypothetical protein [Phycisphaerales bacterium]
MKLRHFSHLLLAVSLLHLTACASTTKSSGGSSSAQVNAVAARQYPGFGAYSRPISTKSPEAQKWFDQGMQLLYGFNHDEAIRSFLQAAALDPDCAMAWWGASYAHGLHINNPVMTEEQSREGYKCAQEALKRIDHASLAEQALIRAVAKRYAWPAPEDRKPLDQAYADAMEQAHKSFPHDPDISALFAESLMDLQPWDYWTHDGQPKGRINEIISVLESTIAEHPDHPGANHFYIHAVEASNNPQRAVASADRLRNLVPGSGHLTHMPSHIDLRIGHYNDAVIANQRAIKADEAYFALAPPPHFYSLYFIHNVHFLTYAAMMEGRYQLAIDSARRIERDIPPQFLSDYLKLADGFTITTLEVQIRFGKWNDILDWPEPSAERLLARAMRRYARTVALANLGRTDEAAKELEQFDSISAQITDDWLVGNNPAQDILKLARGMAAGELAFHQGNRDQAFVSLRAAVEQEDQLVYDEPPGWLLPVRHALGALLVADHRYAEAESVYRADLVQHPDNAWSLLGLEQSLLGQNKVDEADTLKPLRLKAWERADVTPPASCYCAPEPALAEHN